jgi:hypothetical protein
MLLLVIVQKYPLAYGLLNAVLLLHQSTIQFKHPLQDRVFPCGQIGDTFNGTAFSHSSIKIKMCGLGVPSGYLYLY